MSDGEKPKIDFSDASELEWQNLAYTMAFHLETNYIGTLTEEQHWYIIRDNVTLKVGNGWKFHISVHKDSFYDAWKIALDLIMKHEIRMFKVAVINSNALDEYDDVFGPNGNYKPIVIYDTWSEAEDISQVHQRMMLFAEELENEFRKAKIKLGDIPIGSTRVAGSHYIYYAYDRDEKGEYVKAVDRKELPEGFENPFLGFAIHSSPTNSPPIR